MDWARVKEGLVQTVLATMFAGAAGYLFGTSQLTTVAADVTDIKRTVAELKVSGAAHDRFDKCADRRLYAMENGIKHVPECKGATE